MTRTTEAIIVTQWATFLLVGGGHPPDAHDRPARPVIAAAGACCRRLLAVGLVWA